MLNNRITAAFVAALLTVSAFNAVPFSADAVLVSAHTVTNTDTDTILDLDEMLEGEGYINADYLFYQVKAGSSENTKTYVREGDRYIYCYTFGKNEEEHAYFTVAEGKIQQANEFINTNYSELVRKLRSYNISGEYINVVVPKDPANGTALLEQICREMKEAGLITSFDLADKYLYRTQFIIEDDLLSYNEQYEENLRAYVEENGLDYTVERTRASKERMLDSGSAYEVRLVPNGEKTISELAEQAEDIRKNLGLNIITMPYGLGTDPIHRVECLSTKDLYNAVSEDSETPDETEVTETSEDTADIIDPDIADIIAENDYIEANVLEQFKWSGRGGFAYRNEPSVYVSSDASKVVCFEKRNCREHAFFTQVYDTSDGITSLIREKFGNTVYYTGSYKNGKAIGTLKVMDTDEDNCIPETVILKQVCSELKNAGLITSFDINDEVIYSVPYRCESNFLSYDIAYEDALREYVDKNALDYTIEIKPGKKTMRGGFRMNAGQPAGQEVWLVPNSEKTGSELVAQAGDIYAELDAPVIAEYAMGSETTIECQKIDAYNSVSGDADSNGSASVSDIVSVLQFSANAVKYPIDEQGKFNCDVNSDGDVNARDAYEIQEMISQ